MKRGKFWKQTFISCGVVFLSLILGCTRPERQQRPFYFDFEQESELDDLHWECHQLYTLSREHATHGARSLKVELFPSPYPGLKIRKFQPDWSDYTSLRFDVFNPTADTLSLRIRIDDQYKHPQYDNRYNDSIALPPGLVHCVLPFEKFVTSGSHRRLNLQSIEALYFFLVNPQNKVVLYFDYLRLE